MRNRRKPSVIRSIAGFTLLELLLVIAMLCIILAAIYSTFFLSEKAMSAVDDSLVKLQEARALTDTLCRETESALLNQDNKLTIFKIEDRDVFGKQTSRYTLTTFSPNVPGLSLITYYVEEKDGRLSLMKKLRKPYIKPMEKEDIGVEMIEDVDSFSIEVNDNNVWVKTWDTSETSRIPENVRITLTVMVKDRPIRMSQIVRTNIGRQL